ncbi:MAG: sulfatase [Planctomycetota bacterium]
MRACLQLLILAVVGGSCVAQSADRPNVLFILADDLGWRDLSVEGSTFYESPHIDSIANSGTRFTRTYTASPVCSPARASIMSGTYPTTHGVTTWIGDSSGEAWRRQNRHDSHLPPNYVRALPASDTSLAEIFQAAGYTTFFAGKWHLGGEGSGPTDHGFDINIGGWSSGGPAGGYFAPYSNPALEQGPDGEFLPTRLGDETADFIKEHTESSDEPFFAFLSFYMVHGPAQTTEELFMKYYDKAKLDDIATSRFIWDRRLAVRQVQDNPIYGGMIESMDTAIGVVLDQLEAVGQRDNTIIVFTSDNGGVSSGDHFATSNLPFRGGKGRQWEGGIRVPGYLDAQGDLGSGLVSDVPIHGIDWFATLLDLAGLDDASTTQELAGISLVPALRAEPTAERTLYFHYPHYGNQGGEPFSAAVDDNWKLIHYHEDGRHELYDLTSDPGETRDLVTIFPGRAQAMGEDLEAWLSETGALFPTPDPNFNPEQRQARWERLRSNGMQNLERRHAEFHTQKFIDWAENNKWWGSKPN